MSRPTHDYARISPTVCRLYASGCSVQRIAGRVGISVGSTQALIKRLGLSRSVSCRRVSRGVSYARAL